jgi:hypothetical protein
MKQLLFIGIISFSLDAFSQSLQPQVISNGGTSYSNVSGQLDWSIGEAVTATLSSGNAISQGFHQPDLSVTTGMVADKNDGLSVFPNPTSAVLNITMEKVKDNTVAELYNVEGKMLYSSVVFTGMQIELGGFSAGTYLLVITENNIRTRTYQVIKN